MPGVPALLRINGHQNMKGDGTVQLFIARGLRDFGDGFVADSCLPTSRFLDFSVLQIGIIATAALLGSALLTIAFGIAGARRDLRRLLLLAARLMVATGIAFAVSRDFAFILLVAFAGTASASATN